MIVTGGASSLPVVGQARVKEARAGPSSIHFARRKTLLFRAKPIPRESAQFTPSMEHTATTNGMRSSAADCQMRALFGPKMSFNPNDNRIKPKAIGTWAEVGSDGDRHQYADV